LKIKKFLAQTSLLALIAGTLIGTSAPARAVTAEAYDFETTNELIHNFDVMPGAGTAYSQTTSGGIGGTGAINAPGSLNAVFATKNSYSIGSVGSKYTFSSFVQSIGNNGYSGMGFSATPSVTSGTPYRPTDALGISVHGGGFVFHIGATDYNGNWASDNAGMTAITKAAISDLLNNGSVDDWYKVFFIVEVKADSKFDIRVEVWPANGATGELRGANAASIHTMTGVSNSSISNAATIKSYINFSGDRVRYFDNFAIDLQGNTSVISAGAPVVLTNASTLSGSQITFNGNVTSENGSNVTERGFVYSTSSSPMISDSNDVKIVDGSGLGTFTETTGNLSSGTYYIRAYATNTTGTSYGSEETVSIVSAPTLTWAPSNTSVYVSASPLTPTSLATSNSSGAISYAVQSAGTTGCTVNSSTGVLTFTTAGECVVRATVASASPFSSGTLDKTFTVQANSVPGAPTSPIATAGDAKATVSWTAPASTGGSAVTSYTVTANPGGATCTATTPATSCEVTGLTNGTAYTFSITATNATGESSASTSTSSVTPAAPVQNPAPSNPAPEAQTPPPVPVTKVSAIELLRGKKADESVVKLQLEDAQIGFPKRDIAVKFFDFQGKLLKELVIPVDSGTKSLELAVGLGLGDFNVQASVITAGVASEATSARATVASKIYFKNITTNGAPVLLGTTAGKAVYFTANSYKLSASSKTNLDAVAEKLKAGTDRIALTGFSAKWVRGQGSELTLARQRAYAVAKYLQSRGVSNWIYYSGYGAIETSGSAAKARKVELRLVD
jgi:flagellar motor protein MotB